MYELRRLFKRHIEENVFKYIVMLFLILAGVLAGFVFSENISVEISDVLRGEVGGFIDGFSEGQFNRMEIVKTALSKTLRISILIFVGGLSFWLLPLLFTSLFSYGFSLGFTLGYLSLNFGMKGFGVALASVIFVFLINIPTYIIMGVVSFNNSGYKKRSRCSESGLGLYCMVFMVLFLISSISSLMDAFFVPWIIGLICR